MVSIVICSIQPERYEAVCENLRNLLGAEPHEFIGINDARSLAEGYNRGIAQSRGDIIIICHDDIEILSPRFTQRLVRRLQRFDLIGVAGSNRLAGAKWFDAGPPYVFGRWRTSFPGRISSCLSSGRSPHDVFPISRCWMGSSWRGDEKCSSRSPSTK